MKTTIPLAASALFVLVAACGHDQPSRTAAAVDTQSPKATAPSPRDPLATSSSSTSVASHLRRAQDLQKEVQK
jgi:hypothetical protein